jgi:hypothetical protein
MGMSPGVRILDSGFWILDSGPNYIISKAKRDTPPLPAEMCVIFGELMRYWHNLDILDHYIKTMRIPITRRNDTG